MPAPVKAVFSDFKIVKTRGVAQLIFEIPIEQGNTALQSLGGLPTDANWFTIASATIDQQAAPPRQETTRPVLPAKGGQRWHDLSPVKQTGIRCADRRFQLFFVQRLRERGISGVPETDDEITEDITVSLLHATLGIQSRRDLVDNSTARIGWQRIDAAYIDAAGLQAECRS